MSITYNTGIPAGPHSPSADQPLMLINTNAISTYVAVDHVAFNVSTGTSGHHLQVTFDSNNNPGGGIITPPVLFTDNVDGKGNALPNALAELFFYTGDHPVGKDQYVSLATGSALLFGGIIIKWGPGTGKENPPPTTTFAEPFPNNIFGILITSTDAAYTGTFVPTNVTKSDFTGKRQTGVGPVGFFYIAIGN